MVALDGQGGLALILEQALGRAIGPHRGSLSAQLRRNPLSMLKRLLAVRAVRLMTAGNLSVTLHRHMFFDRRMAISFPACWDLQVYGTYIDEAELRLERFMIRELRPGGTAIDVGANVGFFSLLAARLVGPEGRVVAAEPSGAPLAYLRRNMAGVPGVEIVEKALAAEAGTVTFHEAEGAAMVSSSTSAAHIAGRSRHVRRYTVPATTLDALVAERGLVPDLVKLDVEGGELAVLTGGSEVLSRHRPAVAMEVDFPDYESGYRQSVDLMLGHGYGVFFAEADGRATPLDPALVLEHGLRCDRARGFLHNLDNLLFLHPDRARPL